MTEVIFVKTKYFILRSLLRQQPAMTVYQFSFAGHQVTPRLHMDLQLSGLTRSVLSSSAHRKFLLVLPLFGDKAGLPKAVSSAVEACLSQCPEMNLHDPIVGAANPHKLE